MQKVGCCCHSYLLNWLIFSPKLTKLIFCIAGEVERLLRDYKQNQDFIRNLGNRFYQIIYPIQIRQRERYGVSTREVSGSYGKVRSSFKWQCKSMLGWSNLNSNGLFEAKQAMNCCVASKHKRIPLLDDCPRLSAKKRHLKRGVANTT